MDTESGPAIQKCFQGLLLLYDCNGEKFAMLFFCELLQNCNTCILHGEWHCLPARYYEANFHVTTDLSVVSQSCCDGPACVGLMYSSSSVQSRLQLLPSSPPTHTSQRRLVADTRCVLVESWPSTSQIVLSSRGPAECRQSSCYSDYFLVKPLQCEPCKRLSSLPRMLNMLMCGMRVVRGISRMFQPSPLLSKLRIIILESVVEWCSVHLFVVVVVMLHLLQ